MTARKTRTARSSPRPLPGRTDQADQLVAADDRATAYALDVVEGRVVAGPHVRNACLRHLDDLVHGPGRGLAWDLDQARHIWAFFEGVLKLSEGQFEGRPFALHPSQAFKLGAINGWRRASDGTRRFRRAYIEEGKGNGKSPFAGGLGLYGLTADGEAGAQIYAAGAKKEQAGILFADAAKMVRKSPALLKRLKFSGGVGREYNIAYLKIGGFFRPISKDAGKTGSGPRPHFALCDEVHEHPSRDVMEMLERGFKFRRQPLLVMITNSGSDRNSVCYEEHQHAIRVAAGTRTPDRTFSYVGEVIDDTTFSFVCALDPDDDPLNDPSCWPKANPLLGTILTEEYLAGVVAQAKAMPGKLNGILRLHFCVWTDSDEAWISREALEKVLVDFEVAQHHGKEISCGADLSGRRDLTAVASIVETGTVERTREDGSIIELPTFDAWIEAWTPEEGLAQRALADSAPYDVWVKQGFLRTAPGPQIRLDFVAAYFAQLDDDFVIRLLAYDRYAWRKLEEELDALGLKIPQAEHPQGGKRRARPSEDQLEAAKRAGREPPDGLWMPGSINWLEELILDQRIRLKINPVLVSAAMSAAIERDPFDNRWFSKRKATQRIDPLVSLAMAVGAAMSAAAKVTSVYEARGVRRI
jgi:phage terminase large subunit-like protein